MRRVHRRQIFAVSVWLTVERGSFRPLSSAGFIQRTSDRVVGGVGDKVAEDRETRGLPRLFWPLGRRSRRVVLAGCSVSGRREAVIASRLRGPRVVS